MAILLESWKMINDSSGKAYKVDKKIMHRWDNDEPLGIDIFKPVQWYRFLKDFRLPNGKKLPRTTTTGDVIVYQVRVHGVASWMLKEAPEIHKKTKNIMFLFPGYDKEGNRRIPEKDGML